MAEVFFFVAAIGAIGGAYGVIRDWNPFYNVLALVVHLISLAALFLLLRAECLAAAQVVVYAGAVMVLYIFVVAYVGGADEPLRAENEGLGRLGPIFAFALLVELTIAVVGSSLAAPSRGRLRTPARRRRGRGTGRLPRARRGSSPGSGARRTAAPPPG